MVMTVRQISISIISHPNPQYASGHSTQPLLSLQTQQCMIRYLTHWRELDPSQDRMVGKSSLGKQARTSIRKTRTVWGLGSSKSLFYEIPRQLPSCLLCFGLCTKRLGAGVPTSCPDVQVAGANQSKCPVWQETAAWGLSCLPYKA